MHVTEIPDRWMCRPRMAAWLRECITQAVSDQVTGQQEDRQVRMDGQPYTVRLAYVADLAGISQSEAERRLALGLRIGGHVISEPGIRAPHQYGGNGAKGWVRCSGTMTRFASATQAAKWVGPKAQSSNIRMALAGGSATAYGLLWWREDDQGNRLPSTRPRKSPQRKPVDFGGVPYPSIADAARAAGVSHRQMSCWIQKAAGGPKTHEKISDYALASV